MPALRRHGAAVSAEFTDGMADQLTRAVAEQLHVGAVDLDVPAVVVEQHHRVPGLIERVTEKGGPTGSRIRGLGGTHVFRTVAPIKESVQRCPKRWCWPPSVTHVRRVACGVVGCDSRVRDTRS